MGTNRYVAFLHGINVGGRTARKEQLIPAFESIGGNDVSTFLASGNVIFDHDDTTPTEQLEQQVTEALAASLGFEVATFLRTRAQVAAIASDTPLAVTDTSTGTLQVGFMHRELSPSAVRQVVDLSSDVDQLAVSGPQVYWYTTGNMMDSPLGRGRALGKAIGQAVTFRNMNTLGRLARKYPDRPGG